MDIFTQNIIVKRIRLGFRGGLSRLDMVGTL